MSSADLMYRQIALDVDSKCIPYGFQNHCTAKNDGGLIVMWLTMGT